MTRRLVSAQLRPKWDDDLVPWVQELIDEGRLSDAVREGLRILRWLEGFPKAKELVRRGLVTDALGSGLLHLAGASVPGNGIATGNGYIEPPSPATKPWAASSAAGPDPEMNIDALLDS